MSKGKMAAQVAHASFAFIANMINKVKNKQEDHYEAFLNLDKELVEEWLNKDFTKVILGAKNKNSLLSVVAKAKDANIHGYIVHDKCYTELTPEEEDGTCITCIGFPPMKAEDIDPITKRFQLYKD